MAFLKHVTASSTNYAPPNGRGIRMFMGTGIAVLLAACITSPLVAERAWCEDRHVPEMVRAANDQGRFEAFGAAYSEALKRDMTLGDPDAWDWFYRQEVVITTCRAAYEHRLDVTDDSAGP